MENEIGYDLVNGEFTPVLLLSEIEDGSDRDQKAEATSSEQQFSGSAEFIQSDQSISSIEPIVPTEKNYYATPRIERGENGKYTSESIANVCIASVNSWGNLTKEDLIVNHISAGTSSLLFSVGVNPNVESVKVRKVFFRIFSQKVYELYDDSFESEVFEVLAKCKLGPKLIAYTYGGRIEEWIDGNVLKYYQLHDLDTLNKVAELISLMHRKLHTKVTPLHWDRSPSLIRYINRWSNRSLRGPSINRRRVNLKKWLEEKVIYCEALKSYVKNHKSLAFNLGFCHNDAHENNIMIDLKGKFRFVDFEYSGFNYVGCDIANIIVECKIDYLADTPTRFIIHYDKSMDETVKRNFVAFYISYMQSSKVDPYSEVVDVFIDCLDILTLGLNLYWGFWSVLRASAPPTSKPFDFIKYANERFSMYTEGKTALSNLNHEFIQYLEKARAKLL